MSSFNFVFIFIVFYNFVSIVDGFEKPLSWKEARRVCNRSNKILSPSKSALQELKSHYRTNKSVWTSNYVLHLGCNRSTGFCPGLYIEKFPQNESYLGLCQHDSSVTASQNKTSFQIGFKSDYERNCRKGNLVDIINMATLHIAMEEMKWNTKYWINSLSLNIDSFVVLCMLFNKFPNRTGNYETLTSTACKEKYAFVCSEGHHYGTVVSKLNILNHNDFTPKINQSRFSHYDDGAKFFQISGAVSMVVIVFGLIIIGCLIRKWISKMKKELIETLRQKYEHHMYEVERVEPEPETVPETPVSLGGDSLYENVHTGNELSREANMTVSYMTSREIQRPVTVPTSAIETWTQNAIPLRLTLPQRLPSREKAIRRKTVSRQLNTHLKQTRKKQALPETSPQPQLISSGHVQKKNDEISKVEASPLLTIHRPKPSPKPHTKDVTLKYKTNTSRIKEGIQIHDISGEFAFYLNTGQNNDIENTDYLEEDQDYENIWQNSNEQSI
ncbi:uncharacterized protein LOC127730098 [Mytilus californianus]|uniref:uncharacterized protein LOC127730098 n=1 Tax=Mytilus californianus TaxID=6549 RepID=UPI002245D95D|nr:uncharacterized protein LOC127730098 [Mytilus californianus]